VFFKNPELIRLEFMMVSPSIIKDTVGAIFGTTSGDEVLLERL